MEKLLHERLREWAGEPYSTESVRGHYDENDGRVNPMSRVFAKMSDEIERYYIPRPRFEDGEPVQFGDEAQVRDDLGEVCKMVFNEGGCEEVMIGFEYDSSASHYMVVDGEFVKRPAPKVLDADGVSICEGDAVWDKETGERLTVVSPWSYTKDGTVVTCKDGGPGELHYKPEELTHREPDSLEKLRDDLMAAHESWDGDPNKLVDYADRLTALMERSA